MMKLSEPIAGEIRNPSSERHFMTLHKLDGQASVRVGERILARSDDVLVVCDDFALDLHRLRFRPKGSSGGQKGLGDIIRCVGSDEIPRLRIGIGKPPENWNIPDYVLSKFTEDDASEMRFTIRRAADSIADWVEHGTQFCMNKYNGK